MGLSGAMSPFEFNQTQLEPYECGSEMNAGLQNCPLLLIPILEPGLPHAQARGRGRRGIDDSSAKGYPPSRAAFLELPMARRSGFSGDEKKAFVAGIGLEFVQVCPGGGQLAGFDFGLC